jgi:hypothetical protein
MATNRVSKVKGKVIDIPASPPTIGTATAGGQLATVSFTPSSSSIGGPTFTYTAISNPGSVTANGAASPIQVTGLTAGTSYTFSVRGNNPTGSSEFSSASNSVVPFTPNSYESIATVTLNSSQTTITFSSIPSTYKHLQLRGIVRFAGNDGGFGAYLNNNSTSSNYYSHRMGGNGSSAFAGSIADSFIGWTIATSGSASGVFTGMIFDYLDYTSTSKNKTAKILSGHDNNGSGQLNFQSVLFNNTSAISTITLNSRNQGSTSDFAQYSSFALYGIKD